MTSNLRPTTNLFGGPDPNAGGRLTEVQAVELRDLCERLGEPFDAKLSQRQADARIRELRARLDD